VARFQVALMLFLLWVSMVILSALLTVVVMIMFE